MARPFRWSAPRARSPRPPPASPRSPESHPRSPRRPHVAPELRIRDRGRESAPDLDHPGIAGRRHAPGGRALGAGAPRSVEHHAVAQGELAPLPGRASSRRRARRPPARRGRRRTPAAPRAHAEARGILPDLVGPENGPAGRIPQRPGQGRLAGAGRAPHQHHADPRPRSRWAAGEREGSRRRHRSRPGGRPARRAGRRPWPARGPGRRCSGGPGRRVGTRPSPGAMARNQLAEVGSPQPLEVHRQEGDVAQDVAVPQPVVEGQAVEDARAVVEAEHVVGQEVPVAVAHASRRRSAARTGPAGPPGSARASARARSTSARGDDSAPRPRAVEVLSHRPSTTAMRPASAIRGEVRASRWNPATVRATSRTRPADVGASSRTDRRRAAGMRRITIRWSRACPSTVDHVEHAEVDVGGEAPVHLGLAPAGVQTVLPA